MTLNNQMQSNADDTHGSTKTHAMSARERIMLAIDSVIEPLGYETVYLDIQNQRQKILRVFIDFNHPSPGRGIGIEDCVAVTRALDEPLNGLSEVDSVFQGTYELEVSSPGVDRPLRRAKDFDKFKGREIRISVYRPLTADELGNLGYQQKNPKQKNFIGTLRGFENEKILLDASALDGKKAGKKGNTGKSKKSGKTTEQKTGDSEIQIPLELVSKANLEPDFEALDERE
ncbi:MAG: ribosome maturation factor RimP [Bdellovibrionota bacterium]